MTLLDPITGSAGTSWSLPGWVQPGGPPASPGTASVNPPRPLPTLAVPYIAHVYDNDGVTFLRTLPPLLAHPTIEYTVNSGSQDVKLQVATAPTDESDLGHLIVLTEQGGDGSVIFRGFIEDLPTQVNADGTVVWQLQVTSIAAELGRQQLTFDGSTGYDIAVYAQAAVDLCPHLYYTPQSIPLTGIAGYYQFSQSTNVLDECRYMGGVDFFWYVDPEGCVYFQQTPSTESWTFKEGIDYSTSQKSASIVNRANVVNVTGTTPSGGTTPATAQYVGASAAPDQLGPRPLWPPMSGVSSSDVVTLQAVADTLGAIFDRTMHTITVTLPAYPQRVMPGQSARLWEPETFPNPETATGAGYIGPYCVLDVKRDGAEQVVTLGDIPISTSTTDYDSIAQRISTNTSLAAILSNPASLTQPTTLAPSGALLSTAPNPAVHTPPQGWYITKAAIYGTDGTPNDYGAPSGEGVTWEGTNDGRFFLGGGAAQITVTDANGITRVQIGNLKAYTDPDGTVSPAEEGIRVLDPSGILLFDSIGISAAGSFLAYGAPESGWNPGAVTSSTIPWATSPTFTITNRPQRVLLMGSLLGWPQNSSGSNDWYASVNSDGPDLYGFGDSSVQFGAWVATVGAADSGDYGPMTSCSFAMVATYNPGTYTPYITMAGPGAGGWGLNAGYLLAVQLGG